jgi:hypothetical protein
MEYRSLAGALQYLPPTRPDISYVGQKICYQMHAPRTPHLGLVKRVLWYLRGTMDFSLHLHASSNTSLMAYADADWTCYSDSHRSTSVSMVTVSSLGPPRARQPCRAPVPRPSIGLWLMLLLSDAGFVSYFKSFANLSLRLLLSILRQCLCHLNIVPSSATSSHQAY